MDWRHLAACREEDPELFFPIGTTGPALLQIEQAKAACHSCSVIDDCLSWAMESGQDSGVWGGLSEEKRFALKRRGVRPPVHTAGPEPQRGRALRPAAAAGGGATVPPGGPMALPPR